MRALVILLLLARTASAHQTSVKYVDLAVGHGNTVSVTLRHAASDVTEPMGLPNDATPTVAAALAHTAVSPYVQRWLVLGGCTTGTAASRAFDGKFIATEWTASCARTDQLALDFTQFFALDQRHEAIVRLSAPGKRAVQTIVRADRKTLAMRPGESPSLLAWVRTGMDHIYEGIDHILFVLALLLIVMLERSSDGWRVRPFLATLKSTAIVITAFTIAHSITLIAASLGVVSLPSRPVEIIIALSIAYTALEDVIRPDVRWRYALTFAFGLVHGLGFAGVLAELLPPSDVVVPLLVFNLGVEVGQLTIVLVALPIFYGIARFLGGDRYRRSALPVLAGVIFLLGLTMFAERILEVSILPM